jgi:type IV secretion system protein VirB9
MRAVTFSVFLAACTVTTPTHALEEPLPGKQDPHVRLAPYNPYDRTLIVGTVGRSTTITFGATERIERVTFGSQDPPWEGPDPSKIGSAPLKNNLPLWPLKTGRSNMQVTTLLPNGNERLYQFALIVHDAPAGDDDDPAATYGLIFTYPGETQQAAVQAAKARQDGERQKIANARLATDYWYGERNWRYVAQGKDKGIAPLEVSDNRRLTALRFPGNTEVPAIYVVDRTGAERLAAFDMKDDLVVVQTTAEHFRLRLGEQVLEIYNRGYDPVGQDPGTGTTSPDVVRNVMSAK